MVTRDWHHRKDIECGEWLEDGRGRDPIVISARSCMLRVGHEGPHKDEQTAPNGPAFVGPYRIKAKVPQSDIHLLTPGMVVTELVWTCGKKGIWTAEIELGLPAERHATETFTDYVARRLAKVDKEEPPRKAAPPNDSGRRGKGKLLSRWLQWLAGTHDPWPAPWEQAGWEDTDHPPRAVR